MDLRSDAPFWLVKNGLLHCYPPLLTDIECDVVVIGGGVTGALIAQELMSDELSVVVIERREIAQGSTSATTALLQYEIDTHLVDLSRQIGEGPAVRAYQLCLDAILQLQRIIEGLPHDCEFTLQSSLYLASRSRDVKTLQAECDLRSRHGFPVRWCSADDLRDEFGVESFGGIVSAVAATVDPFQLTHQLFQTNVPKGLRVFDRTTITNWTSADQGALLHTDRGTNIRAKSIIFACGYEAQNYLKEKVVSLKSTYAFVTGVEQPQIWKKNAMIWESARPYLYLRRTRDGRIIVGGEDDPFRSPTLRDARLAKKVELLTKRVETLFPAATLESEYGWAGTFGETKDGLGYIGPSPEVPNACFALGFGGNGITFSVVAAKIVHDFVQGRFNPDAVLFRFGR